MKNENSNSIIAVYLSACVSLSGCLCVPVCLFVSLSFSLFTGLSVCLSVFCVYVCLWVCMSFCLPARLSTCVCVCLCVYLSVHWSVWLPQHLSEDCLLLWDVIFKYKSYFNAKNICLSDEPVFLVIACSMNWKSLKLNSVNGCYRLFNNQKSWEDAENACQKENAHLASVASEDEQTMIFQVCFYWVVIIYSNDTKLIPFFAWKATFYKN